MRISVCLVTIRPGGIDVLLAGLKHQEFDSRDFEMVLVDSLYHRRREQVADAFAAARIRLVHTPPRQRIYPIDSCPQARNTCIAKASGELLVWLVDYAFLPSKCLSEHWGVYEYTKGEYAAMGAHNYLFPPPLAYELPDYAPIKMFKPNESLGVTYGHNKDVSLRFYNDVMSGFYDPYMISIFRDPIVAPEQVTRLHDDPYFFGADPKLRGQTGHGCDADLFHAKNESTPIEWCLRVNGFDEGYTGHVYDDTDFSNRAAHAGAKWIMLHQEACVNIVNPRHVFPHAVLRSGIEEFRPRYEARKADPTFIGTENQYDLRAVREVIPWWYQ